jgi:hypothetical protein
VQLRTDRLVGEALGHAHQDGPLALGQAHGDHAATQHLPYRPEQSLRDARRQERAPGGHHVDRQQHLGHAGAFEQVAPCAGAHGVEDALVGAVGG